MDEGHDQSHVFSQGFAFVDSMSLAIFCYDTMLDIVGVDICIARFG